SSYSLKERVSVAPANMFAVWKRRNGTNRPLPWSCGANRAVVCRHNYTRGSPRKINQNYELGWRARFLRHYSLIRAVRKTKDSCPGFTHSVRLQLAVLRGLPCREYPHKPSGSKRLIVGGHRNAKSS